MTERQLWSPGGAAGLASARDRLLEASEHLPFPVASAKVTPPIARHSSIERTALVDRLCALRDVPVIVVVAPAGYGKTTLMRQWAERDPRPFIWLTLDVHDNDPAVLLSYLAVALQHIVDVEPALFRALSTPRNEMSSVAVRLLHAFGRCTEPAVLVLDDLHVLDDSCVDLIADLVDRMPSGWQVALLSRASLPLPVARLRAERRIAELGAGDLAMDDCDAGALLRSADVDLRPAVITALNRQVEGWPAVLYLAALAIVAAPDIDPASDMIGRDRFLVDYVQSEVLARLSADDLEFLTRTSVLDRLSGAVCDAVLDATGSADRLDALERANMLVVPLDHTCTWYRCHRLLRDQLLAALERRERDRIPTLRSRAADWYEANGAPELAIEQAMALDDGTRVASIATDWAQAFYQTGRGATTRRWFEWVDTHNLIDARPALAVTGALTNMIDGRATAAERWLDMAQRCVAADATPTLRGHVAMLQALACRDGLQTALRDAERAVDLVPMDDQYRGLSLLVLGMACALTSQPERGDVALAEAVEVADDTGATPTAAIARAARALVALRDGRADDARDLAEQACAVVHDAGLVDHGFSAQPYAAAARARLEQGEVAGAQTALAQAQRLQAHLNHSMPWYTVQARVEIARCHLALTDVSGARATLREAVEVLRRRPGLDGLVDEITELQHRLDSLHANMAGASSLTAAEFRLLPLLATHLSFREIGARLFISPNTVKTQAISIYRKLGVSSRSDAVDRARSLALLTG